MTWESAGLMILGLCALGGFGYVVACITVRALAAAKPRPHHEEGSR